MPMSNPVTDHQNEGAGKDVILLVDDETLMQDCMAEAMRGAFPHAVIVGVPTIDKLPRPNGSIVSLVLLKVGFHSSTHDGLAGDIRAIADHFPKVPIVVITSHDDADQVDIAVAAGAQGVIPVTASLRIAVAALQLVLAGGTYYPQSVLDNGRLKASARHVDPMRAEPPITRLPEMSPHPDPSRSTGLSVAGDADHLMVAFTAREADVLAALQRGRSNKWIAHHLNLSENTVKVHIRHIMRKLRATNRTEAVVLSHQWLPDVNGR